MTRLLADTFWGRVDRGGGCWEWAGGRDRDGYGIFKFEGRSRRAHRVSWELEDGAIPEGLIVCHRCDNPPCVNPGHLFLGTHADNAADRDSKGRHWAPSKDDHYTRRRPDWVMRGDRHPWRQRPELVRRGEGVPTSRLTSAQVIAIRAAVAEGRRQARVAEDHGVSRATICLIVNRKHWRHVP